MVPAGVEREFVVGDHIGVSLGFREMREAHRWHGLDAEKLRGADATMSRHDLAIAGNEHRIGKAKAFDRRRDLLDLSFTMTSRVTRIRSKRSDRNMLDCWIKLPHV